MSKQRTWTRRVWCLVSKFSGRPVASSGTDRPQIFLSRKGARWAKFPRERVEKCTITSGWEPQE